MIHKQYNEIMANSKKKFSNLYSGISVYSDGKSDGYLKCKINMKSWLLHRLVATVYYQSMFLL